jgi:hypothetical protein
MTLNIKLYDTFGTSINKYNSNFSLDVDLLNDNPEGEETSCCNQSLAKMPLGSYYIENDYTIHISICENYEIFNSYIDGWGSFIRNIIKTNIDHFNINYINIYMPNISHPLNTTNTIQQRLHQMSQLYMLKEFKLVLL